MASSPQYAQKYQQAVNAYMNGTYEAAADLTDELVASYPDDPNLHLLRGHIHCCLQEYDPARAHYRKVLDLSVDPELLDCAHTSLADTDQLSQDQDDLNPSLENPATAPALPGAEALIQDSQAAESNPFSDTLPMPSQAESDPGSRVDDFVNREEFADQLEALEPDSSFSASAAQEASLNNPEWAIETTQLSEVSDPDPSPEEHPEAGATIEFRPEDFRDTAGSGSGWREQASGGADWLNDLEIENLPAEAAEGESISQGDPVAVPSYPEDALDSEDLGDLRDYDQAGDFPDYFTQAEVPAQPASGSGFPGNQSSDNQASESLDFSETSRQFIRVDLPERQSAAKAKGGILAPVKNASAQTKLVITATATGLFSALAVVAALQFSPKPAGQSNPISWPETGLAALAAGVVGGITTFGLGQIAVKQLQRTTAELRAQIDAAALGDFRTRTTVSSRDELGQLANHFNQMAAGIYRSTAEARQKATEQEKAKEDLQRQVIRLLDDVEGAAQGDLTVQAEVTADVLGAVADSFNLTINNLQKLVRQVKVAAQQVSTGAAENEAFAHSLSEDALRQAEELAATLNSVQVLTHSIQQVAASAEEADQVAQSASSIARKGGESVERTVAGILKIRETVAESTRKVKRLAESSQEISKIVALISQIASRTNLLALNASIEAARAGESGRGFAIVADEVRQLSDRAAKASKEIEQIVRHIQSETGTVMITMEEGTQQVIEGTRLAEEAKRSLEDIVQVSDRIDTLVGNITAATVEQTQTSQSMAQVMQAVEMTAQETSQESQRVSESLQNLVNIASDLQTSVETFKVDADPGSGHEV